MDNVVDRDDTKAMARPNLGSFTVSESWRKTLRCRKVSGRIRVQGWDTLGEKDPHRTSVAWDDALNVTENYANAVRVYLAGTDWARGEWVVSTCPDGAVAVYVPNSAGY